MNDLRVLLYAEARSFINGLRLIRQYPKRAIALLPLLGWLSFTWPLRVQLGHVPIVVPPAMAAALSTSAAAVFTFFIGAVIRHSAGHAPAGFQGAAEARFIAASRLDPRVAVAFLQARGFLGRLGRLLLAVLAVAAVLPVRVQVDPALLGFGVVTVILAIGLRLAVPLPAYVFAQRHQYFPMRALGILFEIAGVVALLAEMLVLLHGVPDSLSQIALTVPPGGLLAHALVGSLPAVLGLGFLVALAAVLALAAASDCYPEVWSASQASLAFRLAVRRGRPAGAMRPLVLRTAADAGSAGSRFVPSGSWTLVWREVLLIRRRSGGLTLPSCLLLACVVAGVLLGHFMLHTRAGVGLAVLPLAFVLFLCIGRWRDLSRDLRSPIWNLVPSPMWRRLSAHVLGQSLIVLVPVILLYGTAVLAAPRFAAQLLPILPLLMIIVVALHASQVAVFTLFPSPAEMSVAQGLMLGPVVIAVILSITGGLTIALAVRLPSEYIIVAILTMFSVILGVTSIAIAAWRCTGNGAGIALEEAR